MNKQRLIITSVISIVLVAILLIGSTYSIFTTTEIDENSNVYKTGNLDVSYTLSEDNIVINDVMPKTMEEGNSVYPYRITVTNIGTVPYMFDVVLNNTTAGEAIDSQYIITKVGYLIPKKLSDCTDNIIKEDIILPAGASVDVDVRIWLSSSISNSEMGKSFYAKLAIDGLAVYNDSKEINNDILSLNYMKTLFLSEEDFGYYRSDDYREKIKTVSFVDYIETDTTKIIVSWDVSRDIDNSIVIWLENNEIEGYYNLYIGSKEMICAESLDYLFGNLTAVENVTFDNLDTSLTNTMNSMFYGCNSLTALDLSSFNTNKVTTMISMFNGCSNLITTINIMSTGIIDYDSIFYNAATEKNAQIIVNYVNDTSSLVDSMIATKSSNSNVVKKSLDNNKIKN